MARGSGSGSGAVEVEEEEEVSRSESAGGKRKRAAKGKARATSPEKPASTPSRRGRGAPPRVKARLDTDPANYFGGKGWYPKAAALGARVHELLGLTLTVSWPGMTPTTEGAEEGADSWLTLSGTDVTSHLAGASVAAVAAAYPDDFTELLGLTVASEAAAEAAAARAEEDAALLKVPAEELTEEQLPRAQALYKKLADEAVAAAQAAADAAQAAAADASALAARRATALAARRATLDAAKAAAP
jgi:hypothetical protein